MNKTNFILSFLLLLLFLGCNQPTPPSQKVITKENPLREKIELQTLLDSFKVTGGILIYDLATNTYYSNDFTKTEEGFLPASTFKIPNSIIGLESGYLKDQHHIFKWDGQPQSLKTWEKDLDLKGAYDASCVPCYRGLARGVGFEKMKTWTNRLQFGKMDVKEDNLDLFWLQGESKISQMEQVDFLKRLYLKELPIQKRTYAIMKDVMVREKTEHYILRAKTGTSIRGETWRGWFVGYVEKGEQVFFFATHIDPAPGIAYRDFSEARISFTKAVLRQFGMLD